MFVIHATPLKKSFGREALSYFSPEAALPGSIVSVPLRKGNAQALVLESVPVSESKAEIRSAHFSLRKVEKLEAEPFLSPVWMEAAKDTSEFSAVSYGATLAALLPSLVLKSLPKVPLVLAETKGTLGNRYSFSAFQGSDEERILHYKSIIREEFAKKRSVFLCLSANEDIEAAEKIFSKGIEKYILVWSSKMGKKQFIAQCERIAEEKHPLLIIGSPRWLFLPVHNLGTVILDNEQEGNWKTLSRPFIDLKRFVKCFAEKAGARLVVGDSVLSVETIRAYKEYDPYKFESLNFRAPLSVQPRIIDMKKKAEETARNLLLSPELLSEIFDVKERDRNAFIFSARKGLSSMTVCRDCGESVTCNNCGSPVVLYKGTAQNIFKCHQCGEMRSAEEVCKNCGSWRLLPLGVGVERVREELEKVIPELHLFEINKEATPTPARARKVYEAFRETPGAVLIGTEMALGFFDEKVDTAAIASIDSLFAIPDYHVRERIFHLILKIGSLASEKFLIQTRNAEKETVEMAVGGNILDFYKREIKEREELQYPPFSIFIKITLRGQKPFVKNEMAKVAQIFKTFYPVIFPSTSEKQGSPYAENAVMKIKKNEWPNQKLLALIRSLPPFFEIKVDPDNLL